MISVEKIKKLCDEYEIGGYISHKEISEGILNRNYLLETSRGKYFIKSVREKMKDKLEWVHAVETYMKSKGIPAIALLTTKSGEISVVCAEEVCTVYTFVESDRSHVYGKEDYRRMGEMLGRIHKAGASEEAKSLHQERLFSRPEANAILKRLQGYKEEILDRANQDETDMLFLRYIDFKISAISKLKAVELPNDALIHGDYHAGNLLIDVNSREIIGVCDWEKAEYGPRAYELGRALFYTCFEHTEKIEEALSHSTYFYEGYLAVCPMSSVEIIQGIRMRVYRMALSGWIEEMYYKRNDTRANKFIEHEMRIIDLVVNRGLLNQIEGLLE